ncbi:L-threonylcarbamoyladenylate synthase [Streptomyces chartreusis]|uniref:L-threonylcarbamoyladenylate synthase n=1 Tax=Streptomyces chartreusis TaxID=1969 RepID=UPI003724C4EC
MADLATAEALLQFLSSDGRRLIEAFWPGALSLVLPAASSLAWRLGHTTPRERTACPTIPWPSPCCTVPDPSPKSSANLTGRSPATTFERARDQFGETVHTYLDGGPSGNVPSTLPLPMHDHPARGRNPQRSHRTSPQLPRTATTSALRSPTSAISNGAA